MAWFATIHADYDSVGLFSIQAKVHDHRIAEAAAASNARPLLAKQEQLTN